MQWCAFSVAIGFMLTVKGRIWKAVHFFECPVVLLAGLDPRSLLQERGNWEARYLMKEHRRAGKATFQGQVYNFLERPTGWKCFMYHVSVWVATELPAFTHDLWMSHIVRRDCSNLALTAVGYMLRFHCRWFWNEGAYTSVGYENLHERERELHLINLHV